MGMGVGMGGGGGGSRPMGTEYGGGRLDIQRQPSMPVMPDDRVRETFSLVRVLIPL